MMTPLCYIIHDPKNRVQMARTAQQLDIHGYQYRFVPQCPGHTVTDDTWQSLGIQRLDQGKWVNRPGAWGCFISHYRLWLECREQGDSRIILEHDALAQAAWPEDLDMDQCLWKLWRPVPLKYKSTVGSWNRGAWAYTVTAAQADRLIRFTEQHGALALDKQIGSHAVSWQHWHTDLFLHDPTPRASTTSR